MKTYDVSQSQALYDRARKVVPRGIYGHYGHTVREGTPAFFSRSRGSRFWDVDGNEYVDYMCGYGPMILGYGHPVVEEAVRAQLALGNTVSLAAPVMVELAETLVRMIGMADWALFAKNGGDVTQLAVMVARAATGREKIVTVKGGYHGVAPWMQPTGSRGTIAADHASVLQVEWNRADQLAVLLDAHPGEIACFISSPYHHPVLETNALPADGYWAEVRRLCDRAGVVLIVDDVRAGFRIHLGGSNEAWGFRPDLLCLGKALGNGQPISALLGIDALRASVSEVFYTGSHFFNAAPMAAAVATLRELERVDAPRRIDAMARRLNEGLVKVAAEHGHTLEVSGMPAMPYYRLVGDDEAREKHFRWTAECVRRGAYFVGYHNHFLSTAHDDEDLERTWAIAADAYRAIA